MFSNEQFFKTTRKKIANSRANHFKSILCHILAPGVQDKQ